MSTLPKTIDEELKARVVRLVNDHQGEYSSRTAAAAVVAKQLGGGKESVCRWVIQSPTDQSHDVCRWIEAKRPYQMLT